LDKKEEIKERKKKKEKYVVVPHPLNNVFCFCFYGVYGEGRKKRTGQKKVALEYLYIQHLSHIDDDDCV
jgi:hypothetical protein